MTDLWKIKPEKAPMVGRLTYQRPSMTLAKQVKLGHDVVYRSSGMISTSGFHCSFEARGRLLGMVLSPVNHSRCLIVVVNILFERLRLRTPWVCTRYFVVGARHHIGHTVDVIAFALYLVGYAIHQICVALDIAALAFNHVAISNNLVPSSFYVIVVTEDNALGACDRFVITADLLMLVNLNNLICSSNRCSVEKKYRLDTTSDTPSTSTAVHNQKADHDDQGC
mmetsp:Transcript_107001/g.189502  ORF Transcript_107001/g.189502 Transcript_107001/m.189502 type:complete len:224 (+) Transcript_107001:38-709(+)